MEEFEKPYKKVSKAKALILFLLRPRAFKDLATSHDVAWVLSDSPDIKARYLKDEYKPDIEETRKNAEHRTDLLRKSLLCSGLIVACSALVSLGCGVLLHRFIGSIPNWLSSLTQGVGAGVILWATLWQLTRDMQTCGGKSLPERVHSWLFSSLYMIGTFLFFVVYTWQV